jgi:hypothetical protein
MKPPEQVKREFLRQWLEKAEGDWRVLELAGSCDPTLAENLSDTTELTTYAVEYRYPGDYPPLTMDDAAKAVAMTDRVRDQVRRRLPVEEMEES